MNRQGIEEFVEIESISMIEAMKKIDKNAHGILFATDAQGRMTGCLTDGDIRRWLIHTGNLTADIHEIMNPNPKFLEQSERQRAESFMREKKITALPILDSEKKIVEIAFLTDKDVLAKKCEQKKLQQVPVVIMAGGKGTRLYPYTKILPKPLIPVGDIPIVERIIQKFCNYGIHSFYMTVNYKKSMIKSYFSSIVSDYSIQYVEEDKPLGTGGSLGLIEEVFDRPLIVTNCDILINADYHDIYRHHMESGNCMTIVSALKNMEVPYGVLHTNEKGIITAMEEKPRLSYLVNTGMYIINPELLKRIPPDTFYHMTDLAEELIQEGMLVGIYPIGDEAFLDMGELEEMHRMEKKLKMDEE